jgi:AmmeMemoRadiSam system protein B
MSTVRAAAVSGTFYPGDPERLRAAVRGYVRALTIEARDATPIKALAVPHAGYIYSGPIAASAYARLKPQAETITRVVLLGPVHRVPVRGLALPGCDAFATPLGEVRIDAAAVAALADLRQVVTAPRAHALEHSLEVQLPFLLEALGDFALVPLAVGDATPAAVAAVIERLWGGPETLIVVSTDLSHYHAYAEARALDRETANAVLALDATLDHEQACGATPLNGLLLAARARGLHPRLLDLRNSGDTAGDRARVVGYASFAVHEDV